MREPGRGASTAVRARRREQGRHHSAVPARQPGPGDRGSVLLETVLAIPLLVMVAAALGWAVSLGATTAAVGDVARNAARSIARGDSVEVAIAAALDGDLAFVITVAESEHAVEVAVEKAVAPPLPLFAGLAITVSQRATVLREWP
ncbi:MAG: hypothetical protein Q8M17_12780 [Actinomycetota bacterium]|nr:hypothetical protein [Actinomycetota bacterium]